MGRKDYTMKKYINGKKYDTKTAQAVGSWSNNVRGFGWIEETLYRKKTGEFFIHGEGGAATGYARNVDGNMRAGGEAIRPLSFDEAREWAENKLTGDEYEQIFGEIKDDGTDCLISAIIKSSSRDRLRREAEKTGKSIGAIIDELVEGKL